MAYRARASAMLMTPDEFLEYQLSPSDGKPELVRGEVRVIPPAGGPHGRAATNLVLLLGVYVKAHKLGFVFADGVSYELAELPRTVRAPDASFVRADRLPPGGIEPGFLKLAPDLAVEVLSPSERASAIESKLHDYRTCGTALIWVVDPVQRTVMVVANNAPLHWLHEADSLDGAHVVPGFSCRVSELFEGIARSREIN